MNHSLKSFVVYSLQADMALVYTHYITSSTLPIPFRTHNIISLAREQQQVNLLSELLIYRGGKKRDITVPKFLRPEK
jgi:hypothetical protein